MTLIRNLITARAIGVEPIARALYPDPLDSVEPTFSRSKDRLHRAARRAAEGSSAADIDGVTTLARTPDAPWHARISALFLLLALTLFAPGRVFAATEKTLLQFPRMARRVAIRSDHCCAITPACFTVQRSIAARAATARCTSSLRQLPGKRSGRHLSSTHSKRVTAAPHSMAISVMDAGGALYGTAAAESERIFRVSCSDESPAQGQSLTLWTVFGPARPVVVQSPLTQVRPGALTCEGPARQASQVGITPD
jgi:hypothetical protein